MEHNGVISQRVLVRAPWAFDPATRSSNGGSRRPICITDEDLTSRKITHLLMPSHQGHRGTRATIDVSLFVCTLLFFSHDCRRVPRVHGIFYPAAAVYFSKPAFWEMSPKMKKKKIRKMWHTPLSYSASEALASGLRSFLSAARGHSSSSDSPVRLRS